jgi:YHS domain-containing protein
MDLRVNARVWRWQLLALVLVALSLGLSGAAKADLLFDQNPNGIAIQGYDTVAYFTEDKAVKGSEAFAYEWLGAIWYFASAEHRDLFTANPVKYAPQYGGYCTSGIVVGNTHSADPKIWQIVDGKLYLNGGQYALKRWSDNGHEGIEATDVW